MTTDIFQEFVRGEFEHVPMGDRVTRIEAFLQRLQEGGDDSRCAACFDWFYATVKEAAILHDADPDGQAVYCLGKAMECHVLFRPLQAGIMTFPMTQAKIIAAVAGYFHPGEKRQHVLAFGCLLAIGYAAPKHSLPGSHPKVMSDLATMPGSDADTRVVAETIKAIIDVEFSATQIEDLIARAGSYIPPTPIGGFLNHAYMKKGGFEALRALVGHHVVARRLHVDARSPASLDFLATVASEMCLCLETRALALERRLRGGHIRQDDKWSSWSSTGTEPVYGDIRISFTKEHEISVRVSPLQWTVSLPCGFTATMGKRAESHIRAFQSAEGAGFTVLLVIEKQGDAAHDFIGTFEAPKAEEG